MPRLPLSAAALRRAPWLVVSLLVACGGDGAPAGDAGTAAARDGGAFVHAAGLEQKDCERCHLRGDGPRIDKTGGHKSHAGKIDTPCARCHPAAAPTKKPDDAVCASCHQNVAVTLDGMSKMHCLSCHDWKGEDALKPGQDRCTGCHAKAETKQGKKLDFTIGVHHTAPCGACHRPHAARAPGEGPVRKADCATCHAKAVAATDAALARRPAAPRPTTGAPPASAASPTPAEAVRLGLPPGSARPGATALLPPRATTFAASHGQCRTCHAPHGDKGQPKQACATCHAEKTPRIHTKGHADCMSCHTAHVWTPATEVRACTSCHAAPAAAAASATPGHARCATCHDTHLAQKAKERCTTCHAAVEQKLTREPTAHADCASCHAPHAPPGRGGAACATCHTKVTHAGLPASHAHAPCTACHTPHDTRPAGARAACGRCPEAAAEAVAGAVKPHDRCLSCHAPHGAPKGARTDCTGCHADAKAATRGVHPTCTGCHGGHAPTSAAARTACASCHEGVVTKTKAEPKGHAACITCHRPHEPVKAAEADCRQCHAEEAAKVLAKDAKGHARCASCHPAHATSTKDAAARCASCHEQQGRPVRALARAQGSSKLGDAHGDCASCHPIHEGRSVAETRGAIPATCRGCHGAVARKVAAFAQRHPTSAAKHGQCRTCHASHGAPGKAQTCTDCHAAVRQKPTLHHHPKHQQCRDCHDMHGPSVRGRDACLGCHARQKDHMPTARECTGCHLFR